MNLPVYTDVVNAHNTIARFIHRTPVLSSSALNKMFGVNLLFKCENFQKVGAFKFRGATNAVMNLSDTEAQKGVATHSSGNHAAALALAAHNRGVKAYVVMPENAPEIKKKAVRGYGAEITYCKPTLQAREDTLKEILERTGAVEVHPYNNFDVIAGQGTAAKELIEDYGLFDYVLCPVGGGGLLAGTSIAVKSLTPEAKVIACEPVGADDACRSFYAGKIIPSVNPQTVADGLLTSLGQMNYAIIKDKTDEIVTVSETAILEAMRLVWERMKIIVEPSSAVPLAAIIEQKIDFAGKKIGVILSGGNVDLNEISHFFND